MVDNFDTLDISANANKADQKKAGSVELNDSTIDIGSVAKQLMDNSEDRYITKSKVGKGGMGTVKAVEDKSLNRIFAMKVLDIKENMTVEHVKHFIDEAIITAQLQHPNIIPVHDIGVSKATANSPESPFYTMKLVEGESLEEILEGLYQSDPYYINQYPLFSRLNIFRKICDAIAYSHSHGVIHRDIKPDNIMIGRFGEALLLDWGLATYDSQSYHGAPQYDENIDIDDIPRAIKNSDGKIKGSPCYLAPEQALAESDEIDRQTDVFLLGSTLYHILTLQPPYTGNNNKDCILKAMHCKFPHPHNTAHGKNVPNTLIDILYKAMALDKSERYKSVQALSKALDNYLTSQTVASYKIVHKGDKITSEGDTGQNTYAILSGSAEIQRNVMGHNLKLGALGKGDVFGEMGALCKGKRTATVRALEDCELLVIQKTLLEDELRKLPPWLEKIIVSMAFRMEGMDQKQHPYYILPALHASLKQLMYIAALKKMDKPEKAIQLRFSDCLHEIVNNLGLTPERVEPTLRAAAKSGIIEIQNKELLIIDFQNLRDFVNYLEREISISDQYEIPSFGKLNLHKLEDFQQIHQNIKRFL